MFDTFTKKCTRNYTAAYTTISSHSREFFNVTYTSSNAIRENKIIAKIFEFKVHVKCRTEDVINNKH